MKYFTCTVCPRGCRLQVDECDGFRISGNGCPRGIEYGTMEATNPTRTVTSTVRIRNAEFPRCPVKSDQPIPKSKIFEAMAILDGVDLTAPVCLGQVVAGHICGTQANFITTRAMDIWPPSDQ